MIPAHVPIEIVLRLPPEPGTRTPIYEEHPVVGWRPKTLDPLVLHWQTGRPTSVVDFIAERGDVISYTFRAAPTRADAELLSSAERIADVADELDDYFRGLAEVVQTTTTNQGAIR